MDYDVITIGAGHNALVASAYLAQAGYKVAVFERRSIVGGAVSTQEIVPGYQFDLGGSAHILIRLTPIIEELALHQYNLNYIELDPLFVAPFRDDDIFFIYRDLARTIDHLDSKFPGEGKAYKQFHDDWIGFSEAVRDTFLSSPSPFQLGKTMFKKRQSLNWMEAMPMIMQPYGEVINHYFSAEKLKAMMVWMAAQSGPPPSEPVTGPFLLWHPLYHKSGIARPRGGSGMLTQALKKHIQAHGGEVYTGSPVQEILVKEHKVQGVKVNNKNHTARAVLSGTHIIETMHHLLPESYQNKSGNEYRTGDGFGAIMRIALDAPVEYKAFPGIDARIGMQMLCETPAQIQRAYGEYLTGTPASDPPLIGMTFSAVDDTLAPPGGEVLWIWAQYYPYTLAGGKSWDDIEEEVANNILDTFEKYAPGTRSKIVDYLFQHPLWLERELGLFKGNVMHLEMSIDQMFMMRPQLGMGYYKGPVKGLYLTGASTHPGGGIMGASGRNAARVLLKDLERKKI